MFSLLYVNVLHVLKAPVRAGKDKSKITSNLKVISKVYRFKWVICIE